MTPSLLPELLDQRAPRLPRRIAQFGPVMVLRDLDDIQTLDAYELGRFSPDVLCVQIVIDDVSQTDSIRAARRMARNVVRHARPGQLIINVEPAYVGATEELFCAPIKLERGLSLANDINVVSLSSRNAEAIFGAQERLAMAESIAVGAANRESLLSFARLLLDLGRDFECTQRTLVASELDTVVRRHHDLSARRIDGQGDGNDAGFVAADVGDSTQVVSSLQVDDTLVGRILAGLYGRHVAPNAARVLMVGLDSVHVDERLGAPIPGSAADVALLRELMAAGVRVDVYEPRVTGRLVVGDAIVPLIDRPYAAVYDLVVIRAIRPLMKLRWLADARAIVDDTQQRTVVPLTLF